MVNLTTVICFILDTDLWDLDSLRLVVLWLFHPGFMGSWQQCILEEQEETKETTLERADFAFQLSMFVTAEREGQMFIIFFLLIFCLLLSPRF